jgi:Histidine phosphatase superfamily (branch 2)
MANRRNEQVRRLKIMDHVFIYLLDLTKECNAVPCRKLQLKPKKWEEYLDDDGKKKLRCTQVQLVFKYGGNLTRLGENQALRLGRRLRRDAYPDVSGTFRWFLGALAGFCSFSSHKITPRIG